jgi:hypothetical protein
MSISGPDGKVIRLPAYSKNVQPITLLKKAPFEIKAQALYTSLDPNRTLTERGQDLPSGSSKAARQSFTDNTRPIKHLSLRRS